MAPITNGPSQALKVLSNCAVFRLGWRELERWCGGQMENELASSFRSLAPAPASFATLIMEATVPPDSPPLATFTRIRTSRQGWPKVSSDFCCRNQTPISEGIESKPQQ